MRNRRYRVGIDVGTTSLGVAAIEVDEPGKPISILNAAVVHHDGALDPEEMKTAKTRKLTAGVARRTRRLTRNKRKRLKALDQYLATKGYPVVDNEEYVDPLLPWQVREQLVNEYVAEEEERKTLISLSLRHMARHRGWRSPYERVESLFSPAEPSKQLVALKERVEEKIAGYLPETATPAEFIVAAICELDQPKLRGPKGILGGKLCQSDNANELRAIAKRQKIGDEELKEWIRNIFTQASPRGSYVDLIGKDALPGQKDKPRASKAHPAFQRYRTISVVTNLRIKEGDQLRRLDVDEVRKVVDFLLGAGKETVLWDHVADILGISRTNLKGTAAATIDGEAAGAAPPVDATSKKILECSVKALKAWWKDANQEERGEFVEFLDDGFEPTLPGVLKFLESLTEEDQVKLDGLTLSSGRAAYSVDSLNRLSARMFSDACDLHEARKAEFGVDDDWKPPAAPLGAPIGNPPVDRVLRQAARWLANVEARWGKPISINIEHVREGFKSVATARKIVTENNKRRKRNEDVVAQIQERYGLDKSPNRSDRIRYEALTRQNGACAYCGTDIDFFSSEMDHILPRAGAGSTNKMENLVASCERCNKSKSNLPFKVWAATCNIPGVSLAEVLERVKFWIKPTYMSARQFATFKSQVSFRFKRDCEDDSIDARSIESVAWMATELHHRLEYHFGEETRVQVFPGSITAEARKASGLQGKIRLLGGSLGKNRLDRRHHAVDAACVAMLRPGVAQVLTERMNIRTSQRIKGQTESWKVYRGSGETSTIYEKWLDSMEVLVDLLQEAIDGNEIPVMQNLRLRLGNGSAHDDTVRKLKKVRLGAELSEELINRASTPALYCALTRCSDYEPGVGLPANESRVISVNGTRIDSSEEVTFFGAKAASIAVRGGYVEIGSTVHHARIYRLPGKKPTYGMLRVFTTDLLRAGKKHDLFTYPIPEQAISRRSAERKVCKALKEGTAEYLGWLVTGDELRLDPAQFKTGPINSLLGKYTQALGWRVDGFYDENRLRMRPVLLASEGLPEDAEIFEQKIIDRPGWCPSVNVIFGSPGLRVIRRNALGEPRYVSNSGLPVCWSVEAEE